MPAPPPRADEATAGRAHRFDTSPLRQHRVFSSDDVDDARDFVSGTLNDHRLEPVRGRFNMQMHRLEMPTITACLLHYGAEVEIITNPLDRFVLVQIPIAGAIRINSGAEELMATPETAQVLPTRRPLRLSWSEGCTQLLLKIPSSRVTDVCGELLDRPAAEPVEFQSEFQLRAPSGQDWTQLLNLLFKQHQASTPYGQAQAGLARQLENSLIGHLLCHQPNNYSTTLAQPRSPLVPRHVRTAEDYMQANLQNPITLEDIAANACVSVRTLCRAFRDARGSTPMNLLRVARLERAREQLLASKDRGSVTDIAMRWGFTHLSRFAAAYKDRFGESPYQTLRR